MDRFFFLFEIKSHRSTSVSASWVLGLKAHTTTVGIPFYFLLSGRGASYGENSSCKTPHEHLVAVSVTWFNLFAKSRILLSLLNAAIHYNTYLHHCEGWHKVVEFISIYWQLNLIIEPCNENVLLINCVPRAKATQPCFALEYAVCWHTQQTHSPLRTLTDGMLKTSVGMKFILWHLNSKNRILIHFSSFFDELSLF